jgi:hypothetical protein
MDRSALVDKLNEILWWEYAGLVQYTHFSFVVRGPLREVSATLEKLLRLVKAVDSPSFGDYLDTGNFHDDPYDNLAQPAPHATNVQITKDLSEPNRDVGKCSV